MSNSKKINEELIKNELRNNSPFFKPSEKKSINKESIISPPFTDNKSISKSHSLPISPDVPKPANLQTNSILEIVRKAMKNTGKESSHHRFSKKEKQVLSEMIYNYRLNGIETNENEITRIAVNYLIQDHHKSTENSILNKILFLLHK